MSKWAIDPVARGLAAANGGVPGPQGPQGDSAYTVAVQNGFVGTESQWLASLVGPAGAGVGTITAGGILFANAVPTAITEAANLFWDDTNNFFGVGTNVPLVKAHITRTNGEGEVAAFVGEVARFQNNNSNAAIAAITVVSGSATGQSSIEFGDKDNQRVGRVMYYNNINALGFFANGAELMRILSTGDTGIGETSPDYKLDVNGSFGFTPGTSVTPVDNGDLTFDFPTNTIVRLQGKGSDATVRTLTFPLANLTAATLTGTETLTNKTLNLATNVITGLAINSFAYTDGSGNLSSGSQKAIPAGAVLGTTDPQTVMNKTISADDNTIGGMAASSFALTTAGGALDGAAAQKVIPAGAVLGTNDAQTVTNKRVQTPPYTIADAAAFEVDPANGFNQRVTLGADRTPKGTNFADGDAVVLWVDDGTARVLTWTDATWGGAGVTFMTTNNTLKTTGWTPFLLMKQGTQVYGWRLGDQ